MTTSSEHAPETLWEDGEFVLSRGVWDGERFPLLAAMPSSAQPSPETLARLQHAYALREELDPAWAARPLRLELHKGRLALLIEDPGGEPLSRLLGRPWEITSFLRVAVGLATALARLHERGLIHKDIKPANILVNAATGAVWLTGFGIASRLPRERQAPAPPEVIAGTLAYMAPEQTGRMNRSIDSRSDLYACGVTLYEMLTGTLPFTASDPMEWIHCHIARQPTPPSERAAGIPGADLGHHLEAARQDRRGSLSDRGGPRGGSAHVPGGMGGAPAHRPLSARRARRVGPAADPGKALRPRARDRRRLSRAFDRVWRSGSAGTRSGVGLCRHRQVLGRQRTAQGARPAARPVRRRQVRSVQARHPLCDVGAGVSKSRPSHPRPRRGGIKPLARGFAGGAWPERPAHGQSDSRACRSSSASSRRSRSSAAGGAESVPDGVPALPRRVRPAGAPSRAVPRRSAMAGRGDARTA